MEPRWPERVRRRSGAAITMSTPLVLGTLSSENVRRQTRDLAGAFSNCYSDRVATAPVQRGEPRVVLTVGTSGEVIDAEFVERAGVPDDVAWCLARRCCIAWFHAPETEQTTIEVPFTVIPTAD